MLNLARQGREVIYATNHCSCYAGKWCKADNTELSNMDRSGCLRVTHELQRLALLSCRFVLLGHRVSDGTQGRTSADTSVMQILSRYLHQICTQTW